MKFRDYQDLLVWQRAMVLAEQTYKITARFPRSETYGLAAQLQRCVVSIPCNISEGHARRSTREFLRFISMANGSLAEFETQLPLAVRLAYVPDCDATPLSNQAAELGKMLHGLRTTLERRLL